jgi:hypothetical protein
MNRKITSQTHLSPSAYLNGAKKKRVKLVKPKDSDFKSTTVLFRSLIHEQMCKTGATGINTPAISPPRTLRKQ